MCFNLMDRYKNYDRQANWKWSNKLLYQKYKKFSYVNQTYEEQQPVFDFGDVTLTFADYVKVRTFYDYWGYINI